jgi:hypothetical protein
LRGDVETARGGRPVLRWALGLLVLVLLAGYAHVCAVRGNDFQAFHDIGRTALARGDVYAGPPTNSMYVFYAPHFSLLMMPFALVPRYASAWIWFALKAAVVVFLVRGLVAALRAALADGGGPAGAAPASRWAPYAIVPLLLAVNPLNGDFRLGQVNLFVFALTLLAITSLERDRPWRAAVFLSIALVKVTPWVFVPWLAARREWRFLARLAVVGAAWLAALGLWFGFPRLPDLFRAWAHASRTQKLGLESVGYFENQSLPGVAARLALAFPSLQREVLGFQLQQLLWLGGAALVAALVAVVVARTHAGPGRRLSEFALMCVVMLLVSPDSRWAHLSQLLAPLFLVALFAARERLAEGSARSAGEAGPAAGGGRSTLRAVVAALAGFGLFVLVVLTRDVVGKPLDNLSRRLGLHTAFLVLLLAVLGTLLLGRHRARLEAAGAALGDAFGGTR